MADPLIDRRAIARPRALATMILLATGTLLGGIDLPMSGYESFRFAPFGLVAGLLGLVYVFALAHRGAIRLGRGWVSVLLIVYWVVATAMAFRVVLPPPGLVQAALAFGAALAAAIVVSRPTREQAVLWVGIVATALVILEFALVPIFEARSGLPDWGPIRLGGTADALRDVFVAYAPQRPATQALHFGALTAYAAALAVQWNPSVDDATDRADLL